jgi:hypothetical protein
MLKKMKDKKLRIQLLNCIDSILKTKPIIVEVIGGEFFAREYSILEDIRNRIHDINVTENELKKIETTTLDFLNELNKCFIYGYKLKCVLN